MQKIVIKTGSTYLLPESKSRRQHVFHIQMKKVELKSPCASGTKVTAHRAWFQGMFTFICNIQDWQKHNCNRHIEKFVASKDRAKSHCHCRNTNCHSKNEQYKTDWFDWRRSPSPRWVKRLTAENDKMGKKNNLSATKVEKFARLLTVVLYTIWVLGASLSEMNRLAKVNFRKEYTKKTP